jgi:hypothetical protein
MKLIINQKLNFSENTPWSAKNGATRRTLLIINKLYPGINQVNNELFLDNIECSVGYLDKGNHSFIFINPPKKDDSRTVGLFLNSSYSYTLISGKELYSNSSSGGYGNSCSTFGLYEVGTVLKEHTYKNRKSASYYELTENGWTRRESYDINDGEKITEI